MDLSLNCVLLASADIYSAIPRTNFMSVASCLFSRSLLIKYGFFCRSFKDNPHIEKHIASQDRLVDDDGKTIWKEEVLM
jgi:hypothetical protein